MYTLTEIETEGLHYLELARSGGESKAQICLNQGGRLSDFVFEGLQILADYHPSTYTDNFASSILFPFANRIMGGEYEFNNSNYKLYCNEGKYNNALHGLVYNETFKYLDSTLDPNFSSVTLGYSDEGEILGFPFKYQIELTYKLCPNGISLAINIINTGEKTFPFTLGWHPYFKSSDLNNSSLNFKCEKIFQVDERLIPVNTVAMNETMPFQLENKQLDTGYKLDDNQIEFLTPEYQLKIESSSEENYLQLFTPNKPNVIAIEPMTGAADSFNNNIGLQTLRPKDHYNIEWAIRIKTTNHKK